MYEPGWLVLWLKEVPETRHHFFWGGGGGVKSLCSEVCAHRGLNKGQIGRS